MILRNLRSTTRKVELQTPAGVVPARVWEGETADGTPVTALITRIATPLDGDLNAFERDLERHHDLPGPDAVAAWPHRLVL